MTCGMTVAPTIPTAISSASPSNFGEKSWSAITLGSGVTRSSSNAKATTITPTKTAITASRRRKPVACSARIAKAQRTAITAPHPSGIPNSRLSPSAAPSTSARSVAIAITSAWSQSPKETLRGKLSRQTSARLRPVAIPSFAESVCTTIAIRFAASTAQSSR